MTEFRAGEPRRADISQTPQCVNRIAGISSLAYFTEICRFAHFRFGIERVNRVHEKITDGKPPSADSGGLWLYGLHAVTAALANH